MLMAMFPLQAAILPRYLEMMLPCMHPVGRSRWWMKRDRLRRQIWLMNTTQQPLRSLPGHYFGTAVNSKLDKSSAP
jgi:hypothetical protein